ncbi:VPLPA-CTERM sorting domain-containing protein [bacterium]|nr:VPLPA-CTERM sorting domain-containing protein [bacterium]
MSYNEVSNLTADGEIYEGWRFATATEVYDLYKAFGDWEGLDYTYGSPISVFDEEAGIYFQLADWLGDAGADYSVMGYINSDSESDYASAYGMVQGSPGPIGSGFIPFYYATQSEILKSLEESNIDGAYLVSTSPVPVPAAAWLFGSALIGLTGLKRKK